MKVLLLSTVKNKVVHYTSTALKNNCSLMVWMKLIMTAFFLNGFLVANDHHMRRMATCLSCSLPDYLFERFSPWSPSGAVYLFPARPAHAATSPCKNQVREENIFVWHNLAILRVCYFVSFVNYFLILFLVFFSYCMCSMLSAAANFTW